VSPPYHAIFLYKILNVKTQVKASQNLRPQAQTILIIFSAACTSKKYFSAASVSEGRAQRLHPFGRKIARFFAS